MTPHRPSREPIRIGVLSDQPLLAEGMRDLFDAYPDVRVVWFGTNTEALIRHITDSRIELVVLGVGADLATFADRLLYSVEDDDPQSATMPPVVCVVPENATLIKTLTNTGRRVAVLSTNASVDDLIDLVKAVADGWHSSAARGAPKQHRPAPTVATELTSREQDVLQLLSLGLPTAEIARRLGVSTNTVRTHIQHVMVKLGAHNRLRAMAIAAENGLLRS